MAKVLREYIVEYKDGLFYRDKTISVWAYSKQSAGSRAVDLIKERDRYYGRDVKVVAVKYKNGKGKTLQVRGER